MTAFLFGLSVAAGLVVIALVRTNLRKLTVFEYERGLQVRLLQVLGERSGNTVVLGVPGGAGPIPARGAEPPPPLPDGSESTEG